MIMKVEHPSFLVSRDRQNIVDIRSSTLSSMHGLIDGELWVPWHHILAVDLELCRAGQAIGKGHPFRRSPGTGVASL
jgi:hypothetical protein